MARMRTVKPEAFTSMSLSDVDRGVRWTFAGLWTHCDDEGRAVWDPRLLKAALYPLDDSITPEIVKADMQALAEVGAVCFYEVAGRKYVHVPSWPDHQHPNRKVASKVPPCPKESHTLPEHEQRSESAVSTHAPLTPVVVVVDVVVDGDGVVEGASSATPTRRATRIADDFKPSSDDISWARSKTIPDELARYETEKFINHWRAKSGRDATKLDWSATWKNWILRATEHLPTAARGQPGTATTKAQGWMDLPTPNEPPALEGATA